MKTKQLIVALVLFCIGFAANAQTARIKGVILDEFNNPIENVTVNVGEKGTVKLQWNAP